MTYYFTQTKKLIEMSVAASLRAALESRATADAPWCAPAVAGVSGTDAHLCHLERSISASIQSVSVAAEVARSQLRSTRTALLFAVNSRCDELEERITTAEALKIAAPERELCAVDSVLEKLRAERAAATDAVASLGDTEFVAQHAELTARLDSADALLLALTCTVIEPRHVGLLVNEPALLASIAAFGRVLAPCAITASDLVFDGVPRWPFARPGDTLQLRLTPTRAKRTSQTAEELEISLGAVATATHVDASLQARDVLPEPLPANVCVDASRGCVTFSIAIPSTAPVGSSVCISSVVVSGQKVGDVALRILLQRGSQAPLSLRWKDEHDVPLSLCISPTGLIFAPVPGCSGLLVFNSNGAPLAGLPAKELGLSTTLRYAAFADCPSPVLLLADENGASSQLIALDPTAGIVRWATAPGLLQDCCGLAALPDSGIAVCVSFDDERLFAHRLSDGERVGSLAVPGLGYSLASDPATGAVFGTVQRREDGSRYAVTQFSWAPSSSLNFRVDRRVSAAGEGSHVRILTVVPPAPGKRVAHLVVGTGDKPKLRVIALPGLALVYTHILEGMRVTGLAADPLGGALAVCDRLCGTVHVLAWPLPGMPVLE